ncbi:MAG: hypothetical protein RSC98_08445 [Clostridia bacterium]
MDRCPQCGSYMVEKRGKRGEMIHLCANETCRCKGIVPDDGEKES